MATFTNQASLSYNNSVISSNVVTGEIPEVLSLDKTAINTTYTIGDTVTYVINIINSGITPIGELTLTDDLGAGEAPADQAPLTYEDGTLNYFSDGVIQPQPTITSTNPMTVTGITVPAQGSATIVYSVEVNSFADPTVGGSVTNTATVSGSCPATADETITAANEPQLSIFKQVSPDIVSCTSDLSYTFTISNSGNTEASGSVVLTDTFAPILKNISVTYNGTPWTAGVNYSYDETTGIFTTLENQITVPPADFAQEKETPEWASTPGTAIIEVTGTI